MRGPHGGRTVNLLLNFYLRQFSKLFGPPDFAIAIYTH